MKKIIVCFLIILILFISTASFYIWQGIYVPKYPVSTQEAFFVIKDGQGLNEIASNLEEAGIIKNKFLFVIYGVLSGKSKELKAGAYKIDYSMNIPELTGKFVAGSIVKVQITIPEGWTLIDIGEYLASKGIIEKGKDFYGVNSPLDYMNFSSDYSFLNDKPEHKSLEGYLFPDTYEIGGGAGTEEIVRKMLNNFGGKVDAGPQEEIAKQNKTIFDIVTMASLIEKEVRTEEDKELVSGVLWKRLKIGMPLQVDATILYITGKKGVGVSTDDTKIDSPYNTYKYRGLPAGPICNPGIESIEAAIHPKESLYLYYLSTPDGETIFSKTLDEHNIAKAKYL